MKIQDKQNTKEYLENVIASRVNYHNYDLESVKIVIKALEALAILEKMATNE